MKNCLHLSSLALAALSVAGSCMSFASDIPGTPLKSTTPGDGALEWLGQWNKLYKADKEKNPIVQEVNLSLRMQYQVGWTDPNGNHTQGGGYDDGFRRFRMGGDVKMFNDKLKLKNIWDIGGVPSGRAKTSTGEWHHHDTVAHLYELNAAYKDKNNDFELSLGKMKPAFTSEYKTSSSAIITVERSALVNQLRSETNWGLQLNNADKKDTVGWLVGAYLNAEDGGKRGDGIDFNSQDNAFVMGQVSYDTAGFITEKGQVSLDYVHNFTDYIDSNVQRPNYGGESYYKGPGAEDIVVLNWNMKQGEFAFVTEIMSGFNVVNASTDAASNVFGVVFMPSYKLTPNWEVVARYQYSEGKDAVKVEKRYEKINSTTTSYADSLNAVYLGVNYYVDSENPNILKIMAGAEYSNYGNESGLNQKYAFKGWTYYLSFRTNF